MTVIHFKPISFRLQLCNSLFLWSRKKNGVDNGNDVSIRCVCEIVHVHTMHYNIQMCYLISIHNCCLYVRLFCASRFSLRLINARIMSNRIFHMHFSVSSKIAVNQLATTKLIYQKIPKSIVHAIEIWVVSTAVAYFLILSNWPITKMLSICLSLWSKHSKNCSKLCDTGLCDGLSEFRMKKKIEIEYNRSKRQCDRERELNDRELPIDWHNGIKCSEREEKSRTNQNASDYERIKRIKRINS